MTADSASAARFGLAEWQKTPSGRMASRQKDLNRARVFRLKKRSFHARLIWNRTAYAHLEAPSEAWDDGVNSPGLLSALTEAALPLRPAHAGWM
ncbi:hypothetical protein AUP68_09019 [Ilyonectria robusta]